MLFSDPKDVTVEVNQWAQFNCTVRCGYTVGWYMAGYPKAIKRSNIVPGLLVKRRRASGCTESDERTHFLRFLPLRHSISQHFIVLLMRHAQKRTAAVVERMGGVTAGPPSLQVRTFAMCLCEILYFQST